MTNQIKSNQSVSFEVFILSLSSLNLLFRPNVLVLIVAADVALCGSSFMRWWRVRLWEFIISRLSHLGKIKKIFLHNQQAVHRTKTGLWQALWKGRMSLLKTEELITLMNKRSVWCCFCAIVASRSDWLWLFWVKSSSRSFCHQQKNKNLLCVQ